MHSWREDIADSAPEIVAGGCGGNGGKSVFESLESITESGSPTNPTIPPDPRNLGKAIYPRDSILEDYMCYARKYAESADCYLIGSVLPVIGAYLGRRVFYRLDRVKYPNFYCLLSGKPGDRKTTAIKIAESLAKRILRPEQFSPPTVSVESLMDEYDADCGGDPDKLLIADDANSVLANWTESSYGKIVSKKYLELYDCSELREAFRKNQKSGEKSLRLIPHTSTSILFGATFNVCRFSKLEVKDGMSRRFLYYVAERTGRFIPNPPPFDNSGFVDLCLEFEKLGKVEGEMRFSESASAMWGDFQYENRKLQNDLPMTESNSAYLNTLTEPPSLVLKLAMVFHLCRYAKNRVANWQIIDAESLRWAISHVNQCMQSVRALDSISQRTAIIEEADSLYAQVLCRFRENRKGDAVFVSKTELTNAFAKNPNRPNALKPNRLYGVILPHLIGKGVAKCVSEEGRVKFVFKGEI